MKNSTKDYILRIAKTFIQAFIPALVVGIKAIDGDITKSVIVSITIPAIAAGLSAVMNINKLKDGETE